MAAVRMLPRIGDNQREITIKTIRIRRNFNAINVVVNIRTIATNTMPENQPRSDELRQRSGFPISRKSRVRRPRTHQG